MLSSIPHKVCLPAGSRYHTLGTFDAMATPKMAAKLLHIHIAHHIMHARWVLAGQKAMHKSESTRCGSMRCMLRRPCCRSSPSKRGPVAGRGNFCGVEGTLLGTHKQSAGAYAVCAVPTFQDRYAATAKEEHVRQPHDVIEVILSQR